VQARPLSLDGLWEFRPLLRPDDRGVFLESLTQASISDATGRTLHLAQVNISTSRRGTIRGIHFAQVPPSQAKYVQCVAGRILDIVVDIRVGSPTFGNWDAIELNDVERSALFISEGLGHAFCALSEGATVNYVCSEPFSPEREFTVHPLDPDLALPWPDDTERTLSRKDAQAPTLAEAKALGILPDWEACQTFAAQLKAKQTLAKD